jgi:hypothetical protein
MTTFRLSPFSAPSRSDRPGSGGRLLLLLIIIVIFAFSSKAQHFPAGLNHVPPVVHAAGVD